MGAHGPAVNSFPCVHKVQHAVTDLADVRIGKDTGRQRFRTERQKVGTINRTDDSAEAAQFGWRTAPQGRLTRLARGGILSRSGPLPVVVAVVGCVVPGALLLRLAWRTCQK